MVDANGKSLDADRRLALKERPPRATYQGNGSTTSIIEQGKNG